MRARMLRLCAAAALSAILLFFFVPFIAVPAAAPPVASSSPGAGGYTVSSALIAIPPPGTLNHLSMGSFLFHWGASDTFPGGFTTPTVTFSGQEGGTTVPPFGFMLYFIVPVIAVTLALLGIRKLTILASLALIGLGFLTASSGAQIQSSELFEYGYAVAALAGAVTVATLWGARITAYWRTDSEVLTSGP
jgi:hypothetical protein